MEIFELIDRPSNLINNLIEIWEDSVKATHLFLSSSEIKSIKKYVPQALREVDHLLIIKNKKQNNSICWRRKSKIRDVIYKK